MAFGERIGGFFKDFFTPHRGLVETKNVGGQESGHKEPFTPGMTTQDASARIDHLYQHAPDDINADDLKKKLEALLPKENVELTQFQIDSLNKEFNAIISSARAENTQAIS